MRSRRSHTMRSLFRQLGGNVGLLALGVAIGGGTFLALDALTPSAEPDRTFSLRAPYYHTCRDAFQDGRTSIRRDEPGYRSELDADNDGIACEPFRRR